MGHEAKRNVHEDESKDVPPFTHDGTALKQYLRGLGFHGFHPREHFLGTALKTVADKEHHEQNHCQDQHEKSLHAIRQHVGMGTAHNHRRRQVLRS